MAVDGWFGNETDADSYNRVYGNIVAQRHQNNIGAGKVIEMKYKGGLGASDVRLGIYADSSGSIGSLLLDAGEKALASNAGWTSWTGLNLDVADDAYYWLVATAEVNHYARTAGSTTAVKYAAFAYSTLPSTFPTPITDHVYQTCLMAGVELSGGGPLAVGAYVSTTVVMGF